MSNVNFERIPGSPSIAVDHGGQGELLVFMHGIGGNRSNWTEQVALFSKDFHTVAWDARGYGDSDDYDGALDFSDFSRDLVRLLDHFGVDQAHICGLSMGGRIAQDFYALFPERVKTLTLVATFSGFDNFSLQEKQQFIDLRKKPLLEGKEPKDIAPIVAKTLIGPHSGPEKYQRLVRSMEALHKDSYIKTVEATTMYDRSLNLKNIAVPTKLIYGENDSLTGPTLGEEMAAQIPDADYTLIPRSGHLINMEEPELFNACLEEFLARHRSGGDA